MKNSKQKIKFLFLAIIIMTIVNFVISFLIENGNAIHLTGENATRSEVRKATFSTLLIGIPFLGFFTGLLLSIFPYKNLKYAQRYLYFSLISILVLYVLICLLAIRNLIC